MYIKYFIDYKITFMININKLSLLSYFFLCDFNSSFMNTHKIANCSVAFYSQHFKFKDQMIEKSHRFFECIYEIGFVNKN